ncbi:MAG TPA: hypothetical protein VEX15_21945 [Nocardioidaceae bacterium]|nr:hypothetical protein [Nocardioidaceae bacterium]
MDDGGGQKRRRRRRRRRTSTPATSKDADSDATAAPTPTPTPSRRAPPGRKPRGTPAPDRAGITTSMAMRAREVSPPEG